MTAVMYCPPASFPGATELRFIRFLLFFHLVSASAFRAGPDYLSSFAVY